MICRSLVAILTLVSILNGGCSTGSSSKAADTGTAGGAVGTNPPGNSISSPPSSGTPGAGDTSSASQISFSAITYSAKQSIGTLQVTATRTSGSAGSVTVHYSTSDGSAIAGRNYSVTEGTVSWQDGESADKIIYVPISDLVLYSGKKNFTVTLSDPTSPATLAAPSTTTVEIIGTQATASIGRWVTCGGGSDDSLAVKQALNEAKNNAFTLVVDCPVRMHFSHATARTVEIADGTTVEFTGTGQITVDDVSPPPFEVLHPNEVTLINWNVKFPES